MIKFVDKVENPGGLEDNGCFRDRNEGQDDECEHAFVHPCDDCPFQNIRNCRHCGEEFTAYIGKEPSDCDVCADCGDRVTVELPAWLWIRVMDKLADTGNPDPEEIGLAYKTISAEVVPDPQN